MKKPALLLIVLAFSTLPAFAQIFTGPTSEFGVMFGGSKRLASGKETAANDETTEPLAPLRNTGFSFRNSVKEIYYSVAIEPDTRFKIKVGEIDTPISFETRPAGATANVRHNYAEGTIQHADAIVDYRFTEPYGSTGLFAGVGLYRQTHAGEADESGYGFSGGVNGDFPITRRIGFVAEATYHRVFFDFKTAIVTVSGGLRFSF
jgi:hypothetical protein